MAEQGYIEIGRRKREQQQSKIPREWLLPERFRPTSSTRSVIGVIEACGVLTDTERHITGDYDATGLLEELRWRRLKSVDVTRAFCKRAALAHQLVPKPWFQ